MKTLAIIGAQWGDEGKGKITDTLAARADLVVRYQGGNNAGHTIWVDGVKTVLHLIPSGVLHPHCLSVISHGVVFDPEAFLSELERVGQKINITPKNLAISSHCNIITSYHKIMDAAREKQSAVKIGTTGKGIGPAYEDRTSRRGIKLSHLLDKNILRQRLAQQLEEKAIMFDHLYHLPYPSLEQEVERLYNLGQKIVPFIQDTFELVDQAAKQNKKILYEGAQGILLDVDYGSYPYVTSSNTSLGGIYTGSLVPGGKIDEVLGIVKAYTTRVGEGPFATELFDATGALIQQKGNEVGATTGRVRRCGWLDLPMLRYAVRASGLTSIALTKVDILSGLDKIKVCTSYHYRGQNYQTAFPGIQLSEVTPIYEELNGFKQDFAQHQSFNDNVELTRYIQFIEEHLGIPVGIVACGPDRSQIQFNRDYFS